MAKAEPNLAEVNRLIKAEHDPSTVTIDVDYALAALRSENARLRDQAKTNAETAARNEETHKKNCERWRSESLKLQDQLLASQDRVHHLQNKLLSLREIVNERLTTPPIA